MKFLASSVLLVVTAASENTNKHDAMGLGKLSAVIL